MAKKRRRRPQQQITEKNQPQATVVSISPIKPWISFLDEVFISTRIYYGIVSKAAYVLCFVSFIGLAAFIVKGYFTRPIIHQHNLVDSFLKLNGKEPPEELYLLGNDTILRHAKLAGTNDAIYFHITPGVTSGFIIDCDSFGLPHDAKNFCLPLLAYYQGNPAISYGFKKCSKDEIESVPHRMVNMQMTPSPNQPRYYLNVPDMTHSKKDFGIPWDEADYFFFLIQADIPTDIYFEKIAILEKK